MDPLHQAWLVVCVAGLLCFVDTPLRTFGQRFLAHRGKERLVLVSLEMNVVLLWAMVKFVAGFDLPFVGPWGVTGLAVVGLLVTAAGMGLAAWAKLRLGPWFSATFAVTEGHVLVIDGPYAFTRHPIYSGLLLAVLGSALTWNSVITAFLVLALAVPFFLHTVYEESLFEKHFGQAYLDYQSRVPRLMPGFRRGVPAETPVRDEGAPRG